MKKSKNNNKKLVILISSIILIIIVITLFLINSYNKKLITDIKSHYGKYIITNKKSTLYNKSRQEVGSINKNFQLELVKQNNKKDKYFRIKDTNFYIYYKDTKKINSLSKENHNEHYITFNKNIKTSKKIVLYKDNKKVIELNNGLNIPIEYISNNQYNIYYLNNIFQVKKSKKIKEIENKNNNLKETEYVSVIYYDNISESCNDYNCVTIAKVKEQLGKLKEAGYYSISLDEYKNYLNNNLRLKEKAILYTTKVVNEQITNINKEYSVNIELVNEETGLKFNSTNKKSTKENSTDTINRYQIKSYSSIENILKMANGEDVVETEPTKVVTNSKGQGIAVLNYHFFYDPTLGEECNEGICLTTQKFREHLDYLKNNGYKTLTIDEFKKWIYGEIEVPQKSVLITVDDGAKGTGRHNGHKLIPLLEEYNMHATLFLIAGWWDIENYRSPNLDIQSHTYDMHKYGSCGKGQLVCNSYDAVKADLQKSLDIIGRKESFCYPFYSSNDTSIQAIKDIGFKMAFVGGNRKATRGSNKYLIPRYPIHSNITLNQFINIIN